MTDYTKKTLGEFLSSINETIRRNATSILKQLQKNEEKWCYCEEGERQKFGGIIAHKHN